MCGDAAKDEDCQEGQRDDEGVEETIVPLPNTVPHPGTMVVESLWRTGRKIEEEEHLQMSTKDTKAKLSSPFQQSNKCELNVEKSKKRKLRRSAFKVDQHLYRGDQH